MRASNSGENVSKTFSDARTRTILIIRSEEGISLTSAFNGTRSKKQFLRGIVGRERGPANFD